MAIAGRVMAKRVMGKLAFLSIRDDRSQMQVGRQRGKYGVGQYSVMGGGACYGRAVLPAH